MSWPFNSLAPSSQNHEIRDFEFRDFEFEEKNHEIELQLFNFNYWRRKIKAAFSTFHVANPSNRRSKSSRERVEKEKRRIVEEREILLLSAACHNLRSTETNNTSLSKKILKYTSFDGDHGTQFCLRKIDVRNWRGRKNRERKKEKTT